MTESEFLAQIIHLGHLRGWRVHHTRAAWSSKGYRTPIQGDPGFPDLVMVRPPRVIIAEIKTDRGELSPAQREWVLDLYGCRSVESYLWKPCMWEEIDKVLE